MAQRLAGKRILLVEDDDLVAMAVEDILAMEGAASVLIAHDLASALAAATSDAFDVAIVDVNLRGTASWPVAQALRDRGIPYVTVTGYGDTLDNALVDNLLPKPYSMEGLLKALEQLAA